MSAVKLLCRLFSYFILWGYCPCQDLSFLTPQGRLLCIYYGIKVVKGRYRKKKQTSNNSNNNRSEQIITLRKKRSILFQSALTDQQHAQWIVAKDFLSILPIVSHLTYETPSYTAISERAAIAIYLSMWNAVCYVHEPLPPPSPHIVFLIPKLGLINFKQMNLGFTLIVVTRTEVALLIKLSWPDQLERCWYNIVDMLFKYWIKGINVF